MGDDADDQYAVFENRCDESDSWDCYLGRIVGAIVYQKTAKKLFIHTLDRGGVSNGCSGHC